METTENSKEFYQRVSEALDLVMSRKTEKALELIESLQRERPDSPEVLFAMGVTAVTMEEYGRGLVFIEEAHNRDPDCYEYAEVLANLHVRVGKLTEGVYFAKLSTTLEPHPYVRNLMPGDLSNFFESLEQTSIPRHYAYGYLKLHTHDYVEAIQEFDRQLMLTPDHGDCHREASIARLMVGDFEKAIAHVQKALHLDSENSATHYRAGRVSQRIGEIDAALFHYKNTLQSDEEDLDKTIAAYASACQLSHVSSDDQASMLAELQKRIAAAPLRPDEAVVSLDRKERIHVAYLTNNGWNADTAAILEPIMQLHDRQKFEVHIYQQAQGQSAYIQQLNTMADFELPLWELDDETAAVVVCGDQIDILVNMCVPELDNRTTLFSMGCSAIQVSYLGLNFGLNIPGITHVICDPMTESAVQQGLGEGQSLRVLRPGLWGLNPSFMLPEVGPAPALENGFLTLGAMCDLESLTPDGVAVLVDALKAAPNSRLIFGAVGALDTYAPRRIAELFADTGLSDRISVWDHRSHGDPWIPDPTYWHAIDLLIVPGAVHAPLRIADALWMGIPSLALKGDTPWSCGSASILASATKTAWSFENAAGIPSAVKEFSSDIPALAETRMAMRDEMRNTALFNPVARVRELEEIYTNLVDERDAGQRSS